VTTAQDGGTKHVCKQIIVRVYALYIIITDFGTPQFLAIDTLQQEYIAPIKSYVPSWLPALMLIFFWALCCLDGILLRTCLKSRRDEVK
jgi:hypothetical protein